MQGLYLNLVITKKGMPHSSQMLAYLYGISTEFEKNNFNFDQTL